MRAVRVFHSTFWVRLLAIGALALAVRVGYVLAVERNDELPGDGFYYHHAALLLADGEGFIDPARFVYGGAQEGVFFGQENSTPTAATALPPGHREPTAGHPPAWTVLLAGVSLLGARSVLAHQLTGAFVGALGVVAIGVLGREAAGKQAHAERVGLIAAFIGALYACLWLNDGMVMSETLVVGVVALLSAAAIRLLRAPTIGHALVFGALGGLGALTRAELAAYVPFVIVALAMRCRHRLRTVLAPAATAAALAVVVVAPWVIRNTMAFDRLVLLSNGSGTVLVQANCDATYHGEKLGYWELLCGLPQPLGPNGEPLDEAARDVVLRERGMDYINAHRTRLVTVVMPARALRLWAMLDPVQQLRFDILVEGRNFRLSVLGLVQFYALAMCAIAGAIVMRRRALVLAPLLLWPLISTMTAVSAFAETRYRVASEVAIVVLAAFAIDALINRRGQRGHAPSGAS